MENNHNVYRCKDCMNRFCESLKEHVIKIIIFKKKKMALLTEKQQELYENANKSIYF